MPDDIMPEGQLDKEQSEVSTPTEDQPEAAIQPSSSSSNTNSPVIWVVLILIVLGLVMAAAYLMSGIGSTETGNSISNLQQPVATVPKTNLGAQLALYDGVVEAWRTGDEGKLSPLPVTLGMSLSAGDIVKTGSGAKAVLEIDDGSAVRLNENSEVAFDELSAQQFTLTQKSGQIYHRVESNSTRTYSVIAAGFTVQALGTAFDTTVESGQVLDVKVIDSAVKVDPEQESELEVKTGEKVKLTKESNQVEYEKTEVSKSDIESDWLQFNKTEDIEKGVELGVLNGLAQELTATPTTKLATPTTEQTLEEPTPIKVEDDNNSVFRVKSLQSSNPGEVEIEWELEGYDQGDGYKVVFSEAADPVYPPRNGDYAQYVGGATKRSTTFQHKGLIEGGDFHFRVCRYVVDKEKGSGCDLYTEDQVLSVAALDWGEVDIDLSITEQDERDIMLGWDVTGEGSTYLGFKIVWSLNENPTYPPDKKGGDTQETWGYKYLSSESARETSLEIPEDEYVAGTWYIRVCRYQGGTCDIYSDQIAIELGD